MYKLVKKLKNLKGALKELNRTIYANVEYEADEACKSLKLIQGQVHADPHNVILHGQEKEAEAHYDRMHKAGQSFLHQNKGGTRLVR